MKIFIMTDMEGVAGIFNFADWTSPGNRYHEFGKELLAREVNAAIEGFAEAGATEFLVCDGHGYSGVNHLLLDNRAQFQRSWVGPYPFGIDRSFDCIAWIGQHPKSSTTFGHLTHTGMSVVREFQINGISVGEFGQIAFCALELGVMPIFGSGCRAFCLEAEALIPGIETVGVKHGVNPYPGVELDTQSYRNFNTGAVHLHPEKARVLIKLGAYNALRRFIENPHSFKPTRISAPYECFTEFRDNGDIKGYIHTKTHPDSVIALLNGG